MKISFSSIQNGLTKLSLFGVIRPKAVVVVVCVVPDLMA